MRNDSTIKQDILDELAWDPEVDPAEIGVTVVDGAVTLTGTVPNYLLKLAAERAARRVAGVRVIAEDISVKLPFEKGDSDTEVARRIAHILEWTVAAAAKDVDATVEDGVVTLSGTVDWRYQRDHIKRQVESVRGVRDVYVHIELRHRTSRRDVQREIKRALHRQADVEAGNVEIDVQGGVVTLSGSVRAFYEKRVIEDAVWAAPGVVQVVDRLSVA